MSTLDTAALRALADAATPGPWSVSTLSPHIIYSETDCRPVAVVVNGETPWFNEADAELIAALHPDTVRALCDAADEVERLRGEVDGTSALAGEALERALVAEARLVEATAQIKRLAAERDDAADEVERLHRRLADTQAILDGAGVEVERLRKAVWASEEIDRRAGMLAGVEAERDASRTAHAALDAEVRALHAPRTQVMSGSSDPKHVPMTRQVCSFCGDNYGNAPYPCATVTALDRHAPTTGATP